MRLLAFLLLLALTFAARADEPFFKKGDVIAIVGGEDMVALSEYGYLELLLVRALPDYHLRFRNLAWEGDTVFEQRRELNFPPWEEQLAKIGATVVLCQFGQMESLAGKEKLPEFIAAYTKLIARFREKGKRRVYVVAPTPFASPPLNETLGFFEKATREMAWARDSSWSKGGSFSVWADMHVGETDHRDGIHMNWWGQLSFAISFGGDLLTDRDPHRPDSGHREEIKHPAFPWIDGDTGQLMPKAMEDLRQLITAKNRLWFDYWRVQNWAFLAGDRTNQPSSRDHLDPAKRWFPEERERFLPLIEAKEAEIDKLAAELAGKAHEPK